MRIHPRGAIRPIRMHGTAIDRRCGMPAPFPHAPSSGESSDGFEVVLPLVGCSRLARCRVPNSKLAVARFLCFSLQCCEYAPICLTQFIVLLRPAIGRGPPIRNNTLHMVQISLPLIRFAFQLVGVLKSGWRPAQSRPATASDCGNHWLSGPRCDCRTPSLRSPTYEAPLFTRSPNDRRASVVGPEKQVPPSAPRDLLEMGFSRSKRPTAQGKNATTALSSKTGITTNAR